MEENSELEEGEACYNEDDDDNIDPEIALSYIDERIKHVLGHFQKDFEGGMTTENFRAKYGGYGSFLPPPKLSSPILCHESMQEKKCNVPNSPGSLPLEGAPQNLKAPSSLPQSVRLQTNSCSSDVHNIRVPLMDIPKKHESCLPLTQAADRCPSKDETSIRSGCLIDKKPLKVRIKVRSDDVARRNAAIYNGLGLDDSPSSSSGDSLDGCERKSHVENSLDSIIQVMTSSSVPGGLLVSPLPESLLWLSKKKKISRESESMASVNSRQEHSSKFVDEMASLQGDVQLLNGKKSVNVNENQEEMEHGNKRRLDSCRKNLMNKNIEVALKAKKFPANGLKRSPLSNLAGNYSESIKVDGGVPEISCEVHEVRLKDKSLASKLVKEEMLLVHEQDYGKNDIQSSNSSLVKKASGNKAVNSYNDDLLDIRFDDPNKGNKTTALLNDYSHASKCVEDIDPHRKVYPDATFHSENENYVPPEKGKPVPTGKKIVKGLLSSGPNGKIVVSKKDDSRAETGAVQKDKKNVRGSVYSCKSKTDKLESHSDSKVNDNQREFLGNKNVESLGYCQVTIAKVSGNLQNEPILDSRRAQRTLGKRSNERCSSTKIDTHSIGGASPKEVPSLSFRENELTSDIVHAAVAPLLIEENWVCCDRCQKWRLLPFGLKPEQLPEKWLCSMLNWLPGMNRCEISEEETTAALNALYQLPVSQNHTNGTASVANTSNVYHLDQNLRNSSQLMSDQGMKKQNMKGMKHAGGSTGLFHVSNSLEDHVQEPGKSRSASDKNYPPEPTLIRKSKVQHMSKLRNTAGGKNEHSLNARAMNGVDTKQLKIKSKGKDDDGHRPSERSKSEDTNGGKVILNSNIGFQSMNRTVMKNNETSFPEDRNCSRKDGIPSIKKLGEQTLTLSDGGSLDIQRRAKRDSFTKKRKLKEDNPHCPSSELADGVYVKEESSERGLRKEGKAHEIKTERKISSSSDGDGNSRKKVRMSPFYSSGIRDFQVDVTEEVVDFEKDSKLRKHNKNGMSEQTLDAIEPLMKDFRSEKVSIPAAVSNSKVSGYHKTKVNYKEVNESFVQSVSPSLRTSNKVAVSGHEIVRKEKFVPGSELKTMKISTQYGDGDAMQKCSSEAVGSQLYNGDSHIEEQVGCLTNNSSYGYKHSYQNEIKKTRDENASLSQKEVLYSKEKDMASTSDHKLKGTDSVSKCPKKSPKIEPDIKLGSGKMSRNETNHIGTNNAAGKRLTDNEMDTLLENNDYSDLRMGSLSNTTGKHDLQQNLILDLECVNKVETLEKELSSGKSKCLSNSDGRSKQAHQKPQDSHGQLLYCPNGEDVSKGTKLSVGYQMENGGNHNLGHVIPEKQGVRNLGASSPDRMESFGNAANNTLKEAKDLRKYADRLKSSGFHFESNEAYFQAALKFLHGASLLETYSAQNGKHGKVSQMQFYHLTVELFRACADEYEKREEMAAAALAYKCMEVAYMRMVYCKHFCLNRDRQELQVTLHALPQGPQGPYQASDLDDVHLNDPTTVDKAILSSGTSCHAAGNQVIVARNLPRLLDFTEIVNFAMEASRKSQNAFAAANVSVEDSQSRDFVASVKTVIDFSFQDVEELIRLVHLALKVSSYSGFGGS